MGLKVYMTHPEHGAMHVYSAWQIESNLKNGWKVDIEPWLKEEPEEEAPKRRGRPPKNG